MKHVPSLSFRSLPRLQALKTITTIKTSGARLLNLINDILDAASMRKVG